MIREGKKTTGYYIEKELHHKLCVLCMVRKFFFGDKTGSKSMIVNDAIREYFINHREEIEKLMDDYHAQGGCGELNMEDLDE